MTIFVVVLNLDINPSEALNKSSITFQRSVKDFEKKGNT